MVFCQGIKDGIIAEKKAAQILTAWKSIIPDGGTKHITYSIGIALFPYHGMTFEELYVNADSALYKAKEQGRNRYVLFDPNQ